LYRTQAIFIIPELAAQIREYGNGRTSLEWSRLEMANTQRQTGSTESESASPSRGVTIEFGREICGSLEIAEQREWLVTNGLGGYASGTVSGNLTRRYHGLLIAALHPPVGRTQLVAKLDEAATYDSANYPLATNRWASGAVD